MANVQTEELFTVDGTPLRVSLARAQRRLKLRALMLVCPLFLFILVTFFIPIGDMLFRSVENSIISEILPRSTKLLASWDTTSGELPSEEVFAAMVEDIKVGRKNRTITRAGQRLNYESPGMSSLFRSSSRKAARIDKAPYKKALIAAHRKWGEIETWKLIKQFSPAYTAGYFLASVDAKQELEGDIVRIGEERRIYLNLFYRTLRLSLFITVMTLILGFPIAYLMAILPTKGLTLKPNAMCALYTLIVVRGVKTALDADDVLVVMSDHGIRTSLQHDTRAIFIAAGATISPGKIPGAPDIRGVGRMLANLLGVEVSWPETGLGDWTRHLGEFESDSGS